MHLLRPEETDLICKWEVIDGKVTGNDICDRIDFLISRFLKQVTRAGWETLYRDPTDGRYWELTYPEGEMHGGGPARLSWISEEDAEAKYGKLS